MATTAWIWGKTHINIYLAIIIEIFMKLCEIQKRNLRLTYLACKKFVRLIKENLTSPVETYV